MPSRLVLIATMVFLTSFAMPVLTAQPAMRPASFTRAPGPVEAEMIAAINAFYASLDPAQQAQVLFKFDDPERTNWHFTPVPRKGLPWKSMTPAQRALGEALIRTGLSAPGYAKADAIQKLEPVLAQLENSTGQRDPDNYYISLFGLDAHQALGWRFEGHHVAFNFTIPAGGAAVGGPNFLGANPATVTFGPQKGLRILSREEDLGLQLVISLTPDQLKLALINTIAPNEIITGNARKVTPMPRVGIPAQQLGEPQKQLVHEIIAEYAHHLRDELADDELKSIKAAGIDNIYFAWAGATNTGAAHYYRLHGPTFLIEFDNTQNNGNHIHSVYRDLTNDFGEDLLRQHYDAEHPREK